MAVALPFMMAAAGAVQAISSIRQGKAANSAAQANAQNLEQQAGGVRQQTVSREELQRQQARQTIGQQIAAGAQAGTGLAGSNVDALRESLMASEMDALNIRYGGLTQANALENQATMTRSAGKNARTSGYLSAFGSILNAGAGYLNAGGTLPMPKTEKQLLHVGGL